MNIKTRLKKLKSYNLAKVWGFLRDFFQLTRLHSGIQATAYFFLSIHLVSHDMKLSYPSFLLGGFVIVCVVSFGFIIDNILDFPVDRVVFPSNALPSGRISYRFALTLSALCAVMAVIGASILGKVPLAITLTNLLISYLYSYTLRKIVLLGNFSIAYLNTSILIFGGSVAGNFAQLNQAVLMLIFLFSSAQEILYTVIDHNLDQKFNLPTTATILGIEKSINIYIFFLFVILVVTIYLGVVTRTSSLFMILMVPCIILPIITILIRIIIYPPIRGQMYAKNAMLVIRFTSFLALWSL